MEAQCTHLLSNISLCFLSSSWFKKSRSPKQRNHIPLQIRVKILQNVQCNMGLTVCSGKFMHIFFIFLGSLKSFSIFVLAYLCIFVFVCYYCFAMASLCIFILTNSCIFFVFSVITKYLFLWMANFCKSRLVGPSLFHSLSARMLRRLVWNRDPDAMCRDAPCGEREHSLAHRYHREHLRQEAP